MDLIKIEIKNDGSIQFSDLSLTIRVFDFLYDLVYCDSEQSQHYFKIFSENVSIMISLDEDEKIYWRQPIIDYSTKSVLEYKKLSSNIFDLPGLVLKMETAIVNDLIKWNKDFILSLCEVKSRSPFNNDLSKNEYLLSFYREIIPEEYFWFNKLHLAIGEDVYDRLRKLSNNLNKLESDVFEMEKVPSVDEVLVPEITFINKLFGDSKRIMDEYHKKVNYIKNLAEQIEKRNIERVNQNNEVEINLKELKQMLEEKISLYKLRREDFKRLINTYESGNDIKIFIESVLKYSDIKYIYDFSYEIHSMQTQNHFVCDISLPNNSNISNVKAYKEYKRDRRIEPIFYSGKDFKKIYDSALFSIVFRIIKEIFESDYCKHIQFVTINGWVNVVNNKNGKFENKCIVSISISREQYNDIYFERVDLRAAFKNLKGISASSLIDYIPIIPLINIEKADSRFIQSKEVLNNVNEYTNLAAIDWEEFEHLVRELFEKEFSSNGGEVKVTQSSRDGGVDAVAFDPDPIRGGKIVIQSKRYTNVVGVSAIRDLYGTVLNEGATKGIIITTSHYGNDAREFAKGKPLTLFDGNNLLYLLEKHGFKAKIDINEAKVLKSQE